MHDNLSEYDNPDVERIVTEGRIEGAQKMVTTLVETLFPMLKEVAHKIVPSIQSIEMLKLLTRQIATAENEKLALWVLNSYAA